MKKNKVDFRTGNNQTRIQKSKVRKYGEKQNEELNDEALLILLSGDYNNLFTKIYSLDQGTIFWDKSYSKNGLL